MTEQDYKDGLSRAAAVYRAIKEMPEAKTVNHPDHYCFGGIECIDYLKAKLTVDEFRGFLRGNALKYLSRAGHKGSAVEDYEKARWYIDRLINESGANDGR